MTQFQGWLIIILLALLVLIGAAALIGIDELDTTLRLVDVARRD